MNNGLYKIIMLIIVMVLISRGLNFSNAVVAYGKINDESLFEEKTGIPDSGDDLALVDDYEGGINKNGPVVEPKNPRISKTDTVITLDSIDTSSDVAIPAVTYDCLWFGRYWQEDTIGDGIADKNDKKQPIKWRVLAVEENDFLLLSDKCLDCKAFRLPEGSAKWSESEVRRWLNEDFFTEAFDTSETEYIESCTFVDEAIPEKGFIENTSTMNKVFLLSYLEVTNPDYGFSGRDGMWDPARFGKVTSFAKTNGAGCFDYALEQHRKELDQNGKWWIRTGAELGYNTRINDHGRVGTNVSGGSKDNCVRPAIRLSRECDRFIYAGTQCTEDFYVKDESSSSKKNNSSSGKSDSSSSEKDVLPSDNKKSSSSVKKSTIHSKLLINDIIDKSSGNTLLVGDEAIVKLEGIDETEIRKKGKAGRYYCLSEPGTSEKVGIVTGVKKGKIKLYHLINKKKCVACTIQIEEPKIKSRLKLKVGDSKRLKLSGTKRIPEMWKSSNESIASVNSDGVVLGNDVGTAMISAVIGRHRYISYVTVKGNR